MVEAIVAGVLALGYIFRLESKNALQDQEIHALKELIQVHLSHIDQRLARIEKKVLNGDH